MRSLQMRRLPLFVNVLVIGTLGAELVALMLGLINADQLLIASSLSGLLTLLSLRLSKAALQQLDQAPETIEQQVPGEA
ncbi:MAG: hypothetical protein HZB95_06180 [Nitrosomonadales bacterium]|nr:hypothetical protein [Nitrosomonadales bacterium]